MGGVLAILVSIWEKDVGTLNGPKLCNQLYPKFSSEIVHNRPIPTISKRPM